MLLSSTAEIRAQVLDPSTIHYRNDSELPNISQRLELY